MLRPVLLAPSVWSETTVATCVALAEAGYPPVGAVALLSLHWPTILRKSKEWGFRRVGAFARRKLLKGPPGTSGVQNPYLESYVSGRKGTFRSLREVGRAYDFPILTVDDINSDETVAQVRRWKADLCIYTGGGVVRRPLMEATRLGVLNTHAGPLPEVRGMSAPEWSLLLDQPIGITAHVMDSGIDTGPLLFFRELPLEEWPAGIDRLRDRLVALSIDAKVEAVRALDRGELPAPQPRVNEDLQYFVMHRSLREEAERRLAARRESQDCVPQA